MNQRHVHFNSASNIPNSFRNFITTIFTETSDEESLQLLLHGITVIATASSVDNSLLPTVLKTARAEKNIYYNK